MPSVSSIIRNASAILSARVFNRILKAAYIVVLARYLGPELYGLFTYGQAWYLAFLPFTTPGSARFSAAR